MDELDRLRALQVEQTTTLRKSRERRDHAEEACTAALRALEQTKRDICALEKASAPAAIPDAKTQETFDLLFGTDDRGKGDFSGFKGII